MKTVRISFSNTLFLVGLVYAIAGCDTKEYHSPPPLNDAGFISDAMQSQQVDAVFPGTLDQTVAAPVINSVGFKTMELTYTPTTTERTLPLYFWYPSETTQGVPARYNGFLASEVALQDVPPIENTSFPVLLFSHGKRGMGAATSAFMIEHFARNGWFVVSWEHSGDTTFNADDIDLTYLHRPLDITAVLDFVFAPDATHGFAGRLDETVLLSGHSRGGYGALAVAGAQFDLESAQSTCTETSTSEYCRAYNAHPGRFETGFLDTRVNGLILLASGDYARFNEGVRNVNIPVLQWTAGGDRNNSNQNDGDPIWNALSGNAIRFNIANGGHFTFTSICSIVGPLGVDNGCDADNYPLEQAHSLINQYSLQFGNAFIRNVVSERTTLLDLSTETLNEPNVTLSTKVQE
jgi:predicted dienelactone hydrolase